jgi:predicted AAA+ superfamily ATPase
MENYIRPVFESLMGRVVEPRRFIQVLFGPRQVGKTTLARQLREAIRQSTSMATHYASADDPTIQDQTWLMQQWDIARSLCKGESGSKEGLLILDEVQKTVQWSSVVKMLWDEDTARGVPLKVMLLGSSALLMQQGLSESLAGRFESIPVTHWSYAEMKACFGWSVDQYCYFGGYPGAAPLISEEDRWRNYVTDSLIETTVSRDILLMTRVDKPALLRRLFHLVCTYSGQILSYQKMVGQLQDAGNTTTLAHYLRLLNGAGLATGLSKYSGNEVRTRASSPKLMVMNTALMTALMGKSFVEQFQDRDMWGRIVESAVGAHLLNQVRGTSIEVLYWLERNREVDFILKRADQVVAIEVKSMQRRQHVPGLDLFQKRFPVHKRLLVGAQGIDLEIFLTTDVTHWF